MFLQPEAPKNTFFGYHSERLSFNEKRYTLCDFEKAPVLFDRQLYQTFEITEALKDLLQNMHTVDSVEDVVGKQVFNELVSMEIIH